MKIYTVDCNTIVSLEVRETAKSYIYDGDRREVPSAFDYGIRFSKQDNWATNPVDAIDKLIRSNTRRKNKHILRVEILEEDIKILERLRIKFEHTQ